MPKFDESDKIIFGYIERGAWFAIMVIVLLTAVFGTFYTIPAGHRGVITTFGSVNQNAQAEGLHMRIPLAQGITKMSIQTQKYSTNAGAASKDLQTVTTDLAINYRLSASSVPIIFQELGVGYEDSVINPLVQEVVKSITAQFTAEELITKRPIVKDAILAALKEKLVSRGIIIEDVSIVHFDFSQSFNEAIEQKVTAEQLKLKADNDLARLKIEAQQKVVAAQAEADSITIQSNALRENKDILQLRAIEKWDGHLPQVTGGAVPFIDLKSLGTVSTT